MICYLGLGSNLSSPLQQLRSAIQECKQIPLTSITKISSIYLSKPIGVRAQPLYYNLVIELKTSLSPHRLLQECQKIEKQHHRIRKQHWGARTLDLDILLFENIVMNTPHLTIPHPQMLLRDFVIIPLREIAPHTIINNQDISKLVFEENIIKKII